MGVCSSKSAPVEFLAENGIRGVLLEVPLGKVVGEIFYGSVIFGQIGVIGLGRMIECSGASLSLASV